jgi:hypothetical protein
VNIKKIKKIIKNIKFIALMEKKQKKLFNQSPMEIQQNLFSYLKNVLIMLKIQNAN